jgi:hypothetical protein
VRQWIEDRIWDWKHWRAERQNKRCAAGKHHWKSLSIDRVRCVGPGCGKWWGQ